MSAKLQRRPPLKRLLPSSSWRRPARRQDSNPEGVTQTLPIEDESPSTISTQVEVSQVKTTGSINQADVIIQPRGIPILPPSSSILETLGAKFAELEAALYALPKLRSVTAGVRICITHAKTFEQDQQEFEDIAFHLIGIASGIHVEALQLPIKNDSRYYMRIFAPRYVRVQWNEVTRGIQRLITKIKINQEKSGVALMECAFMRQNVIHYRDIIRYLYQLQIDIRTTIGDTSVNPKDVISPYQWDSPAYNARYNATLPVEAHRRGCDSGTCLGTLGIIRAWVENNDGPNIFWVTGAPGIGKTTIAYTVCEKLDSEKRLGASFFCSDAFPGCRDVNRIIPTISYQLASFSNDYYNSIAHIARCPTSIRSDIPGQFEALMTSPITRRLTILPKNSVVVIDGLDDCFDRSGSVIISELLIQHAAKLPIKFLITSQTPLFVVPTSQPPFPEELSLVRLYKLERAYVSADIKRYITNNLFSTALSHNIHQLSALAGWLFIFVATVIRCFGSDCESTESRLRLLGALGTPTKLRDTDRAALDRLYAAILSDALDTRDMEQSEPRRLVLWTVVCAREPMTTTALVEFLELTSQDDVILAIKPLLSVLRLNSTTGVVSILHASFRDFLFDPKRSGKYHCDQLQHNEFLAIQCFIIMKKYLGFNMCNLETSAKLDKEVPDLHFRIAKAIPPFLFHACWHWVDHLEKGDPSHTSIVHLDDFLKRRLLFWMEVLNLMGYIGQGHKILLRALNWLSRTNGSLVVDTELQGFLQDAHDFVEAYCTSAASGSTPHIYITALPFASRENQVYSEYWPQMQGLLLITDSWKTWKEKSPEANGSASPIISMALSPDGTRAVSASGGRMYVWDVRDGSRLLGPIDGQTRRINVVAFSPDGTCIVSGSKDGAIRTWDIHTGLVLANPLANHGSPVLSVSFSPNGCRIYSGSKDHILRVHDACTGALIREGPIPSDGIHRVRSITVSPDGLHVLSSDGGRVHLWDTGKDSDFDRTIIRTFTGHASTVISTAFSPDGVKVASGSKDGAIWVWGARPDRHPDVQLDLLGPFRVGSVNCLSFSHDCKYIVSGTRGRTVCLWDVAKGSLSAPPFEGHWNSLSFAALLPNGNRVVSGSMDGTIRFWERNIRNIQYQWPQGTQPSEIDTYEILVMKYAMSSQVPWDYQASSRVNPIQRSILDPYLIPPCSHIIHPDGTILLDFQNIMIGERWHECYIGPRGLRDT